jgi:rubrerythrin
MKYICKKCGHKWLSHLENPKSCPSCKNRKWSENDEN